MGRHCCQCGSGVMLMCGVAALESVSQDRSLRWVLSHGDAAGLAWPGLSWPLSAQWGVAVTCFLHLARSQAAAPESGAGPSGVAGNWPCHGEGAH